MSNMNDNDDVMGFNDEPPATSGVEPDSIPDSAYEHDSSSIPQNENNSESTTPNEYDGYEGWEAESPDDIQDSSQNLTASNSQSDNISTKKSESEPIA